MMLLTEIKAQESKVNAAQSWLRKRIWFLVFVVLPTVLGAFYYTLIASDAYVSEARFVVKSPGQRPSQISSIANLIQTSGLSSGQEQTNEVLDYLNSRAVLDDLSKRLDVRAMYRDVGADFLSRYPRPFKTDKTENFYKYFNGMLHTGTDSTTKVAVIKVTAFRAEDAYRINNQLLDLSEELVNRLNNRAQKKAIEESERRVTETQARLREARVALGAYRNEEKVIDPGKQAGGMLEISNKLISEQAALQAQLDLMRRVAPANPAIPSLESRIAAIGREINIQTGRVVGSDNAISGKLTGYENLELEQEFATEKYAAATAALEQARLEAQKQQFYLERVAEPNLPDVALLPHSLKQILTIAGAALCLYFTGWMLYVGILEHAPED